MRLLELAACGLLGSGLALGPGQSAASNLILNGEFAQSIKDWQNPFDRPAQWSSLDADGQPDSGSARLAHELDGNNGTLIVIGQCIPIVEGLGHAFGADVLLPADTTAVGGPRLLLRVHQTDDCSGSFESLSLSSDSGIHGKWQSISQQFIAAEDVRSAMLNLAIWKASGETDDIVAHFDNVFLRDEWIFGSGFEP